MATESADKAPEQENPFALFESESFEAGEPADKAPEPVPTPAPAESKEDSGEEGESSGESDEVTAAEEEEAPRKKSVQERINEVTKARREAERRAEAAERELARMRAAPQEPPKPREPAPQEATEPDPDKYQFGELDPKYIVDLVDYRVEQKTKLTEVKRAEEERRRATEARAEELHNKSQKIAESGAKLYDDFYEKVFIGAERGEWPLSPDLGALLVESDVGADIAYHLASNPREAALVYAQTPLEQARYFGRMEMKFSAQQRAATGTPGSSAPAITPRTPPPVTPARGAGGRFQTGANSSDFAAFEKAAMGQK